MNTEQKRYLISHLIYNIMKFEAMKIRYYFTAKSVGIGISESFYRAVLRRARYYRGKSSVCPPVRPSV